jgi:hypothetical protein
MKSRTLLALFLICASHSFGQIHFFHFVDSLFQKKEIQESVVLKQQVQNAGYKFTGVDSVDQLVLKLAYMHLLMTCYYSVDGDTSGGFGIPYFWNYTNHNPREQIIDIKKGKPLKQIPAYPGSGGASMATLDRTPYIFWSDFMTDEPRYSYEHISSFYTFGWCSEREMAYKAWLTVTGVKSTIGIKADHVWTEIDLPGQPGYFLFVDNTFNRFEIWPVSKKPPLEIGNKYINWYNQQGADKTIAKKLSSLVISPKRAADLEHQIMAYFASNEEDY